ncbi:MAG TPA: hypothetical protein VIM12_06620 [Noviherbaspirillum sp.]|jgi:hypothetical protein|uniref:hypothetical protein n=1 Tax=Noviherbaspirillum sp. TaxID=1926288 RepID=UPI002F94A23C
MNEDAPTRDLPKDFWPGPWVRWLKLVTLCLGGWNRSLTETFTYNFGSIAGGAQTLSIAIVPGVSAGAMVVIRPIADVAGVIFEAITTSKDNITIYAKNFTNAAVDPGNTTFRVIVVPGLPVNVLAAFSDAVYNMGPTIACNTGASTAACNQLPRWGEARVGGVWSPCRASLSAGQPSTRPARRTPRRSESPPIPSNQTLQR